MFARTCHGVKITPWMAYVQYESTSSFMQKIKRALVPECSFLKPKVDSFLLCV